MPRKVAWTPQAREDLRAIRTFIARDAPATAAAFIRGIRGSVGRLREFPQSGGVVPEVADPEIREILHGDYRIVYRVTAEQVQILAVFHGASILSRSNLPGQPE